MCLAIPGKVTSIDGKEIVVSYVGNEKRKAVAGRFEVGVGDYVLVQMGMVIEKLSKEEYDSSMSAWNEAVSK